MKNLNLFEDSNDTKQAPLASRMRPLKLDEIVGQQHIIGKDKLLYRAIKADRLGSIILYGPPGTGKTTIARVIANTTNSYFSKLNATNAGIKDVEKTGNIPIPPFLQDASYKNAYKLGRGVGMDDIHAFPNHYSGKNCMPDELKNIKYFKLSGTGNEKKIQEFLNYLKNNMK